jgi:hypothetical protein
MLIVHLTIIDAARTKRTHAARELSLMITLRGA